jgi:molybdate transport system permease protein
VSSEPGNWRPGSDRPFLAGLAGMAFLYGGLLLAMLAAGASYLHPSDFATAFASPDIRYAVGLSLITCTVTAVLSVLVATPVSYLLSRFRFPGRGLVDTLLDIPIVLPPLVIGLFLLILFQIRLPGGARLDDWVPMTYTVGAVVLAQFTVGCAFAVRAMRAVFDHLGDRPERVALTLGCSRFRAFWWVVLPSVQRGMVAAGTLAWARSMGEFGPILVFAGATRQRTEVLPTTVFLELSVGNLEAAVAVSMLMVVISILVLLLLRSLGDRGMR